MSLINRRLTAVISFQNTLNGFWVGRGTRTVVLDDKLLQHLTSMMEAVLFEVFLDPWKAYDVLDRERALGLLTAYGVGPSTVRLLRTYWDQLTIVDKAGEYFGRLFKGYLGLT